MYNIRTTSGMTQMMTMNAIGKSNMAMFSLMAQMSTGDRLVRPSDDPADSRRINDLESYEREMKRYQENSDYVLSHLEQSESVLSSLITPMDRGLELLVSAGQAPLSMDDREAIAAELESIMGTMLGILDTKTSDGSSYLFSGNQTQTSPIEKDPVTGEYIYMGDEGEREVPISDGVTVDVNSNMEDIFFGDNDFFNQMNEMITVLRDPTIEPGTSAYDDVLHTSIECVNDTTSGLTSGIASLGARTNGVLQMQGFQEDMKLITDEIHGNLNDTDLVQAVTDLTEQMTALQAVQKTYAEVSSTSLFDYV